jgi:hypothetical protein
MTTRNFRVKNGLSVGDITISASAGTITGLSTAAPSADGDTANKKYVDDSINAISTTSITTDSNATNATVSGTGASGTLTITANSNTEVTVTDSGMQLGGSGARVNSILDQDDLSGDSDTALATQQSIKAYVDAQVTASDLDFQGDSGGALSIDLDSETLDIAGGTGIDTTGSGNTLTVAIDSTVATLAGTQTFTNKTFDANGTGNSLSNIDSGNFLSGFFKDEDDLSSNSATSVASQQSIKAYIDNGLSSLSSTTLTAGNTTAVVSDTGSDGAFTVTADGNTELVINDTTATFSGNVVISGNLTTNGTTVTNSSTNTTIEDALIELGSGNTGSNANDLGLILERGSTGNNGFMGWDESEDKFIVGTTTGTGASTGNLTITTGTLVANIEGNVTGDVTGTADVATAVTVADESSDTSCNVLFTTAATGDLGPKSGTNLTFNSSSGVLTATGFAGDLTGAVTGNADTATEATNVTVSANNTANETVYLTFVDGATGTQGIETDTGLSYNPSTNVLSTTASAAQYADVAERFEADAPMEIGSVVEVGGTAEITEATSEMSQDVFGVISDKPAYMMNAGAGDNDTHPFVAMTGRTPVRVTGVVNKGQRLVTSSIKGCARAVAQGESISPFNVIGRALESNTEAGIKLVNCAVRTNN